MKNLVYLVLNNEQVAKEAIASIHSFFQVMEKSLDQYRIVIYTNIPEKFDAPCRKNFKNQVIIKEIDENMMVQWSGMPKYIYRGKILVLINFLETYGEPAIFIDTDTFFMSDPTPLFRKVENKRFLMNYVECSLKELISANGAKGKKNKPHEFFRLIYHEKKLTVKGRHYDILEEMPQWNSGVIGAHPIFVNCLYEALALSDYVWETHRLRTAEQFALGFIFQLYGTIESADEVVFHYWFTKEARYLVENALGVQSVYEKKYVGTEILQTIEQLTQPGSQDDLIKNILHLSRKHWKQNFSSLFNVISAESYMGKRLRESL